MTIRYLLTRVELEALLAAGIKAGIRVGVDTFSKPDVCNRLVTPTLEDILFRNRDFLVVCMKRVIANKGTS